MGGGGRDGEDRLGKELLTIVSVAFFFFGRYAIVDNYFLDYILENWNFILGGILS